MLTTTRRNTLPCFIGSVAVAASLIVYKLSAADQAGAIWVLDAMQAATFLLACLFYRFAMTRHAANDRNLEVQFSLVDLFLATLVLGFVTNQLRLKYVDLNQILLADLELIGYYPRVLLNVAAIASIHSIAASTLLAWLPPAKTVRNTLAALLLSALLGSSFCAATQFLVFYYAYPSTRGSGTKQLGPVAMDALSSFTFSGWLALSVMLFRSYGLLPQTEKRPATTPVT